MEDIKKNFLADLETIKGFFSDGLQAFYYLNESLKLSRSKSLELLRKTSPEHANDIYLDTVLYVYGEELDPVIQNGLTKHHTIRSLNQCTQGELRKRNSVGGENYYQIGSMALVMIYQLWEDNYRIKLSTDPANLIKTDIFGDMKIIRNSIIHNKGILSKNLTLIKGPKAGKRILVSSIIFSDITTEIEKFIKSL